MKRLFIALITAAIVGALAVAAPLVALPKGTQEFNDSTDTYSADDGCGQGDDHQLFVHAPAKLWPPNHKYFEDIHVTARSNDAGESVALQTTGWHDQYVSSDNGLTEQNGSGNTADDITVNREKEPGAVPSGGSSQQGGYPTVVTNESGAGAVETWWLARSERSGEDIEGRIYTLQGTAQFGDGTRCSVSFDIVVPHDMRRSNR